MNADLVRTDGTPITEMEVRRGLRVNIVAGALGNVFVASATSVPLALLLQALGASGVLIGLATTVQQLAMLVQIPAAFIAERFTSRKKVWAWVLIPHRLMWFIPAMLPFLFPDNPILVANAVVAVVGLSAVLAHGGTACWFSWMADLIPPETAGRFWGTRQSYVQIVYLIAIGVVGFILNAFPDPRAPGGTYTGFAIVFAMGAAFGTADILVHLAVPEPRPKPARHELSLWQRVAAPLQVPDFRWVSLAMGVWAFGGGLIGTFSVIYLRRDFDVSYLQLSATLVAVSLGAIFAGFQSGYLIDRLGARTYGVLLIFITPLVSLIWFFVRHEPLDFRLPWIGDFTLPQPVVLLIIVNLAAGALYSSLTLCQVRLLSAVAPQEGRTMAMAVHWTIVGTTAALGPILGGTIMDWFDTHPIDFTFVTGTKLSFFQVLVVVQILLAWCVCAPLLRKVSVRKGDWPIGTALPHLWLGNPMRAVRNVYSMYAMTAAVSTATRADAVRDLGKGNATIAVTDLIEKLDDASYEVREEAAIALGRLGTVEAIVGLIVKLESPDCDIAPQIARALRHAQSPLAVDALLRCLTDRDRETTSEAARALGFQSDSRATEPLLTLIATATDNKVFAAAAEALAQLREPRASQIIIQRLRGTQNQVLKTSLRLALGDLLGRPGEFYRILARERETRGTEVERLLREVGDHKRQLERAYEKGNIQQAAELLAQLAARHNVSPEARSYLESLRDDWTRCELPDVLLGIYALSRSVK